jgi:hypothetical protein
METAIRIPYYMKPVCLYTYETARADNTLAFIKYEGTYNDMFNIVERFFGREWMDNKITLHFECIDNPEIKLYITFWDNKVSIGTDVYFFVDLSNPVQAYRKVLPLYKK